ncbi:MAG: cytochrome c maturation protein CcmE [Myxococcales bacterium]|nr:cytochrome c maturation protein CcmE [Myxococcales bacterium]
MSKDLDKELAEAAGIDGKAPAQPAEGEGMAVPSHAAPAVTAEPRKRSLGLLVTLLALAGGLVALFLVGFKDAAIYAQPIDEYLGQADKMLGRKVRVDGELVPNSLKKQEDPCEYRFQLRGKETQMPVRFPQCVIPDTFRDMPGGGVQVTVEGEIEKTGTFLATTIMAKCTSKYDPASHQMAGKEPSDAPAGY